MNAKETLRYSIWNSLKEHKLYNHQKSPYGKIPDFKGSDIAAEILRNTPEWEHSKTVFSSPDSAQKKVRELGLKDGKLLIMASPQLKNGYILINPEIVKGEEKKASTINGAFKLGQRLEKFPVVDLVVEGSVAVDFHGNRLGKGGGYADREIEHLFNERSIKKDTPIVTTVHEIQIVNKVPVEVHDKKINMIVTPERIIRVKK